MKYKVGDKVKVHTIEWFETNCSKDYFDSFEHENGNNNVVVVMTKFCGQEVTINQMTCGVYHILEDDGKWNWEDWMFEDMNNNTNIIFNPNIVEDFAKLIGVELDKEFYDNAGSLRYKFTADSGLMLYDDAIEDWRVAAFSLTTVFEMIKKGRLIKKWMPKDGDTIFFPAFLFSNLYDSTTYDSENEHDKEMLRNGLYFRTKEEAVECAKKIIKQMKEG